MSSFAAQAISLASPDSQAKVRRALEASWSEKTSYCYNPSLAPVSYGQCAATAIVVQERYGGEILRSEITRSDGKKLRHFYNRIDGQRLDFTADQLEMREHWSMAEYLDIPSSAAEAETELVSGQLDEMRRAFRRAIEREDGA
jgi:hypothetical protein